VRLQPPQWGWGPLTVLLLLLFTGRVGAQAPAPPGPWVLDVRGTTSGLPSNAAFFPPLVTETQVPTRALGLDVGAHVYLLSLGPARIGIGADYIRFRGTSGTISATVTTIAPGLSFNFGTANGWSYLSGGVGRGQVTTTAVQATGTLEEDSSGLTTHYGAGARWFLRRHLGIGFDLRWHRLSWPPKATVMSLGVGFSIH
jgi:hypothetical protein